MEGYAKIAGRMATLPNLAIFRQFQALRAQNLLYMQAELVDLEQRFRDQAEKDGLSQDPNIQIYSRDWFFLSFSDENTEHSAQWKLALEIRDKLGHYGEDLSSPSSDFLGTYILAENALLRYRQISSTLSQPHDYDIGNLANNLDNGSLPDYLLGQDRSTWKDQSLRHDLVAVNNVHSFGILSRLVIKFFLSPYHRSFGLRRIDRQNEDANMFHYEGTFLERPANIISTILASLLPILAIVILYCVHSMPKRLGIVAAFTVLFAAALSGLTRARMIDIFAATSTFAAVQVVFIATNVPTPGSGSGTG